MNLNIDDAQKLARLEQKIDRIEAMMENFSRLLIRQKTATERTGLHPGTLAANGKIDKFEEIGHRRTFIELGEIAVVQKRKPRKKAAKRAANSR